MINARFEGDPNMPVTGINEIHMVEAGDMTFVDHPKYYAKALHQLPPSSSSTKRWSVPKAKP